MMKKSPKPSTSLPISALLLLALILVFYASGYLDNDTGLANKPEFQTVSYCNTMKGCQSRVGEGLVSFNILPPALPTGQPLDITVELSGLTAQGVTMAFIGRDMPMGLMPFSLKKQSGQRSGSERYTGTGSITFCTADNKMVWIARVRIETREAIYRVLFELDTLEADKQ